MALRTAHKQTPTLLAQTIIANGLSHMEIDSSRISTPPEKEPVMECSLLLTTLSGETFQVSLSVAKFDRSVTDLKVFGCFIDFLHNLGQATARHGMHYCLSELQCYPAISRRT